MCRRTWNRKPFHDFKAAPAGDVLADCILGAAAYLGKYGAARFRIPPRRDLSSLGEQTQDYHQDDQNECRVELHKTKGEGHTPMVTGCVASFLGPSRRAWN
jgi:hypothetical protein